MLVVDDDESIRQTLRDVLEYEGYSVTEAADGQDALAVLQSSLHPLIVLLDLRMPGMDGTGVLRAVANDMRLTTSNVFALITANSYTIPLECSRLLSRLSVPVVPKPFDIDLLLSVVSQIAYRLAPPDSDSHLSPPHSA